MPSDGSKKTLKSTVKQVVPDSVLQARAERKAKRRETQNPLQILLLTNRDSDNVGDQVIEACDIALIKTIMTNLGIEDYDIHSHAGSIVTREYMETRDKALLERPKKLIEAADVVIFGGAPVFNYRYQLFSRRTAITLRLAKQAETPVIFSAVGVEGYDEDNKKCQRLKEALNFDVVQQITTRDNFEALQKFKERESLRIDKVADPAVFTPQVLAPALEVAAEREKEKAKQTEESDKKKVGVFILRSAGFKDNGIDLPRDDAATFWNDLVEELECQGYDYELLTSGHFGDEAYLDYLQRDYNWDPLRCVFNVNSPDVLVSKIASYDAIISCRLHPSIIAFSLGVPSIGIVWNDKVTSFYETIGYDDRLVTVDGTSVEQAVKRLGEAIEQGVDKDEDYLYSVYGSLFAAVKDLVCPDSSAQPYGFQELLEHIPSQPPTSPEELDEKLERKFRRAYKQYNEIIGKRIRLKAERDDLREENERLRQQLGTNTASEE
ncbi:MAG: polysaccharide pyruvyl transferase family protein [Coriobacteriaceae bacterium]|nr:polysaccharide pyruvyl transferase family protein [Coriobacteriaceae bacterium]